MQRRVVDVSAEQEAVVAAVKALVMMLHTDGGAEVDSAWQLLESSPTLTGAEMHAIETIYCVSQDVQTETAVRFFLRGWLGAAAVVTTRVADQGQQCAQNGLHATEQASGYGC